MFHFSAASSSLHQDDSDESRSLVSLQYGFDTIRVATKNFSEANELGKGGFGTVYKVQKNDNNLHGFKTSMT